MRNRLRSVWPNNKNNIGSLDSRAMSWYSLGPLGVLVAGAMCLLFTGLWAPNSWIVENQEGSPLHRAPRSTGFASPDHPQEEAERRTQLLHPLRGKQIVRMLTSAKI